jgi:integrase
MLRKHVEPALGDLTLDQIRPIHLTSFFQKHRENGMATHYQLNLYSMLRTMFDVAVEYDLIESSPIRRKIHRPKSEPAEKAVLTAEEIQATLDQIPAPWRTLFACVAVTGLRSGEALGLRWKNIDWHAETLSVTHSLWRSQLVTPKTKKSIRTLHMPDALRRLLEAHYASSGFTDLDDYVFCKADGSPCDPNYLRKEVLYPAMDTAGIKRSSRAYGFHLFRHSAATIAHAETQNLKGTQDLLGHSRMSTTSDIYLHSDGKGTKEATEAIAKKVFETCSPVAPNLRPGSNRIQ